MKLKTRAHLRAAFVNKFIPRSSRMNLASELKSRRGIMKYHPLDFVKASRRRAHLGHAHQVKTERRRAARYFVDR